MNHPKDAKLAYEGTIFKVFEWPQVLFDGSTVTFEAIARQGTAMIVAEQGGDILYSREEQPGKEPYIGLFGGRIEWGEDPLVAAKRELLEEAGLESDDWRLIFENNLSGKIDWPCFYYMARNCRKVAEPHLDPGEKVEVRRITPDRFFAEVVDAPDFRDKGFRAYFYSALNAPVVDAFFDTLQGRFKDMLRDGASS